MVFARRRQLPTFGPSPFAASQASKVVRTSVLLLAFSEHLSGHPHQQFRTELRRTLASLFVAAGRTAAVGQADTGKVKAWREPFVDDGLFDPRRDYWGIVNKSKAAGSDWAAAAHRGLATAGSDCGPASSSDPCCIECFGLTYCDVLNGYKVEDKYYPTEPTILGSCDNFEDRASRLDVFGPSKTFRDTEACREMVLDYTCLWWGSNNEMYDNRCGIEAQVYPCRSYCVQLAKTCANNMVEWAELCRAIDCPPTDEECMPGPYSQDPDEACYIYEYHSPLNAARRGGYARGSPALAAALVVMVVVLGSFGR